MGGGIEHLDLMIVQDETGAWVHVLPPPAAPETESVIIERHPVFEPEPVAEPVAEPVDVPVSRASALIEEAQASS